MRGQPDCVCLLQWSRLQKSHVKVMHGHILQPEPVPEAEERRTSCGTDITRIKRSQECNQISV